MNANFPNYQAPKTVRHIECIHTRPISDLHIHDATIPQRIALDLTYQIDLIALLGQGALCQIAQNTIGIATRDEHRPYCQHNAHADQDPDY